MYFFVTRESERKANQYEKMYRSLERRLSEHDTKMAETNVFLSSYRSSIRDLSNTDIPSREFDPKRESIVRNITKSIQKEEEMRRILVQAKITAKEKMEQYKQKVEVEIARENEQRQAQSRGTDGVR